MPVVWRLASPAYARTLDREGSRRVGGRWNSPGRPMVYTSTYLSLAVLEVFAHIPAALRDELPTLEAVQIEVPDDASVTEVTDDDFLRLMGDPSPLSACRARGDAWLARGRDLALSAPSVLVFEERNIMLNPLHERMRDVRVLSSRAFRLDPRLGGRAARRGG